jgi:hypothetical protein
MTEPASFDATTPKVLLGGKSWPVPELAIRQLRAVRRPLIDLTEAIAETEDASTGDRVMRLSTAQYEAMCEVVYQGLTRAHPQLTRDEFLDLACGDAEIFLAFLVVRRQSGVYVMRSSDVEASIPGEAHGSASPIGTG